MKLSLCITTYNRYELTIESFAQVLDDPRIDDIVIMDDCSKLKVRQMFYAWMENTNKGDGKVRFIEQAKNRGMSINKHDAISYAKNEWAIIFDSDNIIDPSYLDAFYKYVPFDLNALSPSEHFIFCPDFAKPNFDYRALAQGAPTHGLYNAKDAARCAIDSRFNCLLNTCNYIVNRDFYLSTYIYNKEHIASDTVWHNYNHLKAGGELAVVPGMQYYHRVHDGSGFMQNAEYNMSKSEEVRKLIQQL